MAIKTLRFKVEGINEIRLNNPQAADPLNKYAIEMKAMTAVRKKDEEHILKMREIEIRSKLYWDDELGVYFPSNWIMEAIAKESFAQVKVSKAKMRSAVFPKTSKIKLNYEGMDTVKSKEDLVLRDEFKVAELIKQGQVRIVKMFPQFKNWSFEAEIEFDERTFTEIDMRNILDVAVRYNGFGDFRPTYGRGIITEWEVLDA